MIERDARIKRRSVGAMSALLAGFSLAFVVINVLRGRDFVATLDGAMLCAFAINYAVYRRTGNAAWAGGVGLSIGMTFALIAVQDLGIAAVVWIYAAPVPAFYFLGLRGGAWFTASWTSAMVVRFSAVAGQAGLGRTEQFELTACFVLVSVLAYRVERLRVEYVVLMADLAEQAQDAVRAKDRFFKQMSHELRTPLNAILGFAQIMQRRADFPADYRPYVERIDAAGTTLLRVVNTIIDFAQLEAGELTLHPSRIDVAGLARDVAQVVGPLGSAQRVAIDGRAEPGASFVGDRRLIEQALVSLLSVALRSGERQAPITLGYAVDASCRFWVDGPGGAGAFDGGGGAFELSIVQAIVRKHGGHVAVTSTPDGRVHTLIDVPADALAGASLSPVLVG